MHAKPFSPLSLLVQTLNCCIFVADVWPGAGTPLRGSHLVGALGKNCVSSFASSEVSLLQSKFVCSNPASEVELHRSAPASFVLARSPLAPPSNCLLRSSVETNVGLSPHSRRLQQSSPGGYLQRLFIRFCFDDALPENTANKRKRKGALSCPVKRFLRSCEAEDRKDAKRRKKKAKEEGGSSSTALKCMYTGRSAEAFSEFDVQKMEGASPACSASATEPLRFVDIGANLVDCMFRGNYHGTTKHPPDLERVLHRAEAAGVERILLTSGSLEDLKENLELCRRFDPQGKRLFTTVGVHPTRCKEFEEDNIQDEEESPEDRQFGESELDALRKNGLDIDAFPACAKRHLWRLFQIFVKDRQTQLSEGGSRIVAVGEIGLDEDRQQFCPLETQKKYFEMQLALTLLTRLPMFLHMRKASSSFFDILSRHDRLWAEHGGVVHSFTGSSEEARRILALGLFIGLNGCSLKTDENVETVRRIPVERLLLETDAPWCDMRPSHAAFRFIKDEAELHPPKQKPEKWSSEAQVKGRNEPANIKSVFCGSEQCLRFG